MTTGFAIPRKFDFCSYRIFRTAGCGSTRDAFRHMMLKIHPRPVSGCDASMSAPPQSSSVRLTRASPMPVPAPGRPSVRNGRNTASRTAAGMPGPSSATVIARCSLQRHATNPHRAAVAIVVLDGVVDQITQHEVERSRERFDDGPFALDNYLDAGGCGIDATMAEIDPRSPPWRARPACGRYWNNRAVPAAWSKAGASACAVLRSLPVALHPSACRHCRAASRGRRPNSASRASARQGHAR